MWAGAITTAAVIMTEPSWHQFHFHLLDAANREVYPASPLGVVLRRMTRYLEEAAGDAARRDERYVLLTNLPEVSVAGTPRQILEVIETRSLQR